MGITKLVKYVVCTCQWWFIQVTYSTLQLLICLHLQLYYFGFLIYASPRCQSITLEIDSQAVILEYIQFLGTLSVHSFLYIVIEAENLGNQTIIHVDCCFGIDKFANSTRCLELWYDFRYKIFDMVPKIQFLMEHHTKIFEFKDNQFVDHRKRFQFQMIC